MLGRNIHQAGTLVLSAVMVIIGVALIVQALAGGSSILSGRLLIGLLFAAAGCGRIYVELRRGRRT
jgi:hypothetical protein